MPLITIVDSNIAFECQAEDTIARAALRAGLGMPYECNVGSCGTCKVEMIAGAIASAWPEAPALSERDRGKNRVLGCQAHPLGDCTIKVRLAEQYAPRHRPQRFAATLIAIRDITHDIREFHLQTRDAPLFLPGQYALLSLPGVKGQRAYSMSNVVNEGGAIWQFQIKRMQDGQGTTVLFDRLQMGARLEIDGPFGSGFLRVDSSRDVVCISGGSGISPMLSIARAMMGTPAMAARKLHFFYGGRTRRDLCGETELRELPGYGQRLFYYPSLSMPETGDGWSGHGGFVHENVLSTIGGTPADFEYYFAGPPAMTQAIQRLLMQNKVPLSQMHFDQFY
ncbi:MAG TPA: 2Fe-2S iron-sulfur cluster-binding protein [Usitatibacteraceae bacterium]